MKHLNLKITGKVQGVFFRAETRKKAESLGLFGFVRNEADGSVYLEVEGEETLLKELERWCRDGGPELATTEKVEATYGDELKSFNDFTIRLQ